MPGERSQGTDLVARLVLCGNTVSQYMNLQLQDNFTCVEYCSRDSGLLMAFRSLDRNKSGFLELNELRALVTTSAPALNLEQVCCAEGW